MDALGLCQTRAKELDGIQRRMLGIMMNLRPDHGESVDTYVRRRGTQTSALQGKMGRWSDLWPKSVLGWSEHLERPRNADTWAAMVSSIRPPTELEQRRWELGKVQTRRSSGWIRKRWFEAVRDADSWRGDRGHIRDFSCHHYRFSWQGL